MIPNVFISSTIEDLHYLRDAIREAVLDLSYNPVMSEYGGVGYIQRARASDACYIAVKQCHLAVLILGKKYGTTNEDGISTTHREFLTARENELPMITFVDAQVMQYKKVFDAEPGATIWDKFPHMDNPRATFGLITEVLKAPTYNGLIEFTTAAEAKHHLKNQIAHYVGDRLSGIIRPVKTDINEILAEVKTLRNLAQTETKGAGATRILSDNDRYYTALRFLLDERSKDYTKFVEVLFGDLDVAVKHIVEATTLDDLLTAARATIQILPANTDIRSTFQEERSSQQLRYASQGPYGAWAILGGRKVTATPSMKDHLEDLHSALQAKLQARTKT